MPGLVIADSMETVERLARGHYLVEVFDERGRLVQKEEAANFIALPALAHAKWATRSDFSTSWPGVTTDVEPVYPFYRVMLTDSAKAESAGTETMAPGKTVAWANRSAYTGNGTLRGNPNALESSVSPTQCKWVFDWSTSQGIGTFQSLCWAFDMVSKSSATQISRAQSETWAWWGEAGLEYQFYGSVATNQQNGQAITGQLYGMIHEESTGSVWRLTSRGATQVQKWTSLLTQPVTYCPRSNGIASNPSGTALSGAFANDFTFANAVYDMGYPGSGGTVWCTQNASPYGLQRFNFPAGGAVQQTIARPWSETEPGFVAFDGTNLYCCRNGSGLNNPSVTNGLDPSGPVTIYKVRASDGVTLGSWSHPRKVQELGWDTTNNRLLVGDAYGIQSSANATATNLYGQIIRAVAYDATGVLDWQATVLWPSWMYGGSDFTLFDYGGLLGYAGDLVTGIYHENGGGQLNAWLLRYKLQNLGSRALLGAPVTKSSLQTMKVTHTITFT